ncbi:sugar O-acetyltransferase [Vibrio rotiferianus]|uniref:sugar O-acetyltransferase n=1 Tax=Vibrio rotiferianus TaxID=190895 RepID=UPI00406A65F2
MIEFERMKAGLLYDPANEDLIALRESTKHKLERFNNSPSTNEAVQKQAIEELFGTVGEQVSLNRNFWCDYGINIKVGDNFYANHDCVILDCAEVNIGNNCLIGPQVGIYTACHPLNPIERRSGKEFAKPITIGNDCWIGGNATINPGVTLGNNVVVASGSVVTKSFGDNVVIGGNPARVIKHIE